MKLIKEIWLALIMSFLVCVFLFVLLALEQDKLNARIRTLELKAGMSDPWAK